MSWVPDLHSTVHVACSAVHQTRTTESRSRYQSTPEHQTSASVSQHHPMTRQHPVNALYGQPLARQQWTPVQIKKHQSTVAQAHALIWQQSHPIAFGHRIQIHPTTSTLHTPHSLTLSTATVSLSVSIPARQQIVDPFQIRPNEDALRARELFTDSTTSIVFDDAPHIPSSLINWAGTDLTLRPACPVHNTVTLRQYQPETRRRSTQTDWQDTHEFSGGSLINYPVQPPAQISGNIPKAHNLETHILMNSVQTFTLPDATPLALADISISLDLDSFSWKLSAVALNDASAALLTPDTQGRKELAIIINGHRWEFFISKTAQSKSVSDDKLNKRFSVTGYSRSQYLADPYAPKRTRSIGTTTAVQAAIEELTGTGFALNWDTLALSDWTLPNASFSYQSQTPLAVIKKLATTAGGIVQPDMATNTLYVRPRFSVTPWQLNTADIDATLHESQILNEQHTDEPGILYNQIFVSGENEGVSATITRQNTAGDRPAPDISDSWITAIECNTSRGKTELAQSGNRISHSLEIPVPEKTTQPGLLQPGMTVAVQHHNDTRNYHAYVTSVSISVPGKNNAKVRQSITLDQPTEWKNYE